MITVGNRVGITGVLCPERFLEKVPSEDHNSKAFCVSDSTHWLLYQLIIQKR